MTQRALVLLRLRDDAVFSARAATEGMHRSLAHPTGAALLGWAAQRYDAFDDPWGVFHSGKVQFSNAVPLSKTRQPAFAMPQTLNARKDGHYRTGDILDRTSVRVGRPDADDASSKTGETNVQWEALPKEEFLTLALEIVRPATGRRLRTATREGRALTNALFEYGHVDGAQEFAATIEADGISENDWRLLGECLKGDIALGRSKSAEYGAAEAFWLDKDAPEIWPKSGTGGGKWLILWALSDIAALDENGAPTLAPTLTQLFADAPDDPDLDRARSAVSGRRWAPWNAHRGLRDIERVVIAAGSVLAYRRPDGWTPPADCRAGLWQEAGLGRFWADPPLLCGENGTLPEPAKDAPSLTLLIDAARQEWDKPPTSDAPSDLVKWLARKADLRAPLAGYSSFERWRRALRKMYEGARERGHRGPSRSHWGAIAALAKTSVNFDEFRRGLEDAMGRGGAAQRDTWDALAPGQTFRGWLNQVAEEAARDNEIRSAARKLAALRQLADEGRKLARTREQR